MPLLDIRAIGLFCALNDRGYRVQLTTWRIEWCRTRLGQLETMNFLSRMPHWCNVHGESVSQVLDGRYGPCPAEFTANRGATAPEPNQWHRDILAKSPEVIALVNAHLDRLELDHAALHASAPRKGARL